MVVITVLKNSSSNSWSTIQVEPPSLTTDQPGSRGHFGELSLSLSKEHSTKNYPRFEELMLNYPHKSEYF
jgi:hypothetical protein